MEKTTMMINFGKYKGLSIDEVADEDPDYLEWLLEQDWVFPPIKRAIENTKIGGGVVDKTPTDLKTVRLKSEDVNWVLHWLQEAESDNASRVRAAMRRAQ